MKKSVVLGLVGGAVFAVGAAVGYVAARVVDVIQFNRLSKVMADDVDGECDVCDGCCGCCDLPEETVESEVEPETEATSEAVAE